LYLGGKKKRFCNLLGGKALEENEPYKEGNRDVRLDGEKGGPTLNARAGRRSFSPGSPPGGGKGGEREEKE